MKRYIVSIECELRTFEAADSEQEAIDMAMKDYKDGIEGEWMNDTAFLVVNRINRGYMLGVGQENEKLKQELEEFKKERDVKMTCGNCGNVEYDDFCKCDVCKVKEVIKGNLKEYSCFYNPSKWKPRVSSISCWLSKRMTG